MWALWALWAQEASAAPWRATSSSVSITHIYRNYLHMLCSGPIMSTVWRLPSHIACPLPIALRYQDIIVVTQTIDMGHSLIFLHRYCLSFSRPGYCPSDYAFLTPWVDYTPISCLENFTGAMWRLSLQTISWLIYSTHLHNFPCWCPYALYFQYF